LKIKEISEINVARPDGTRGSFGRYLISTRQMPHFTCVWTPDLIRSDGLQWVAYAHSNSAHPDGG